MRPAAVFQGYLGFDPPADVRGLQSRVWVLGDSGVAYLHFQASPQTVQRMVARGLTPGGSFEAGTSNPPQWWNPPPAPPGQCFEGHFTGRNFGSERETLLYNPTTADAWFQFVGVD